MRFSAIGALVVLLILPTLAFAQPYLQLSADADGNSCEFADPGPDGLVTVYILLKYSPSTYGVRFSAPVPPGSGLTHIVDTSSFTLNGNSQSDLIVGTGQCLFGDIVMGAMLFTRTSEGETCNPYFVQPGAIYLDCAFSELPLPNTGGVALNSDGNCNPVPIRNPSPTDGATDVPLTVELKWDDAYYICNAPLAASGSGQVYFGTTSNPPYSEAATINHTVGPLAPNTTYYWWVYGDYPYTSSPVWSFTTTDRVAAKPSTWGAVKALYR